jgi:uncharacterized repeat protein (TIGR03803 family)
MTKTAQPLGTRLRAVGITLALAMGLVPAVVAQAQTFTVLYNFTGASDGGNPNAGLIQDAKGNLYSTTTAGGTSNSGVVFELNPKGTETVLHSFTGGSDGGYPYAGLVRDAAGNLYGTTYYAGASGAGVVFKVVPKTKTETVLYGFTGGSDGEWPYAGLVLDTAGNLYGTTLDGGASGSGTAFKVVPKTKKETVLYSFTGSGGDGAYPFAGLVRDSSGNLYGVTVAGGTSGYGTVFKVAKTGKETVLYSFTGGADGGYPIYGYLVRDSAGNLYGTTEIGGTYGYGTVFKVSAKGTETVLYSFTGGADGGEPISGLVRDAKGNLYGTTFEGGSNSCQGYTGCGTVFEVSAKGTETVLHSFDYSDGAAPFASLLRDAKGNLYGTTFYGGSSAAGTVFKLTP